MIKTACAFAIVKILSVHDGDTFTAQLDCPTPFFCQAMAVRIDGIDTPEIDSKIPWVAAKAQEARNFTQRRLAQGINLRIEQCHHDKYGGRIDGKVLIDGQDLGTLLIDAGHARIYTGKGPKPWPSD